MKYGKRRPLQLFFFLSLFVTGSSSFATLTCANIFTATSELTLFFGAHNKVQSLPAHHLRLLVWNVHKGTDASLPQDFHTIAVQSDLVLLQESVSDLKFTNSLSDANKQLGWTQAKSFERRQGDYTGVATGSRAQPVDEEVLVSKVTEPLLRTPKTILISEFSIEGKKENLMVANVHAINFATIKTFQTHIDQLISKIVTHTGPLLVAGDFNTWSPSRLRYLNESLEKLGLKSVNVPRSGFLILDHIYARGLKAQNSFRFILYRFIRSQATFSGFRSSQLSASFPHLTVISWH